MKPSPLSAVTGTIILLILASSTWALSAECTHQFPCRQGWLGGDEAFSISLNAGRVLWLFGDSFVGSKALTSRAGATMIANTVAISTCAAGKWNIRYHYRRERASGSPQAFFDSGTDKYRLWPLDGFVDRGSLYVFLIQVDTTGNGSFSFKEIGAKLVKVSNPASDPTVWSIQYYDLLQGIGVVPGVSAIVAVPYVYLYIVLDRGGSRSHQLILARIPLDHRDSPSTRLEYFSRTERWKI